MLSEDSDTEQPVQLTINEHYAKAYAYRKEREELGRLKEKYGSDAELDDDDEDSEDLESEDEDGEELTPGVDAAILRLLAKIKRKDPDIYDKDKPVFEQEKQRSGTLGLTTRIPNEKSKPITLRQHKLAGELDSTSRSPSPQPLTHVQEQQELRDQTIAAFHQAVQESDDDLLIPREKTKDELDREEEEYQEFLRREVGEDLNRLIEVDKDKFGIFEEPPQDLVPGKKKVKGKDKPKGTNVDDQEFLMNYILNRGWIDRTAKRLPTYAEVTSLRRSKGQSKHKDEQTSDESVDDNEEQLDGEFSADSEFDDVADVFETSYNFRFEEPDATVISRHPRTISSTVRRQDTTRKDARERRKTRKEEELLKKREEVKRLKALKMKELKVKLERIGRESGWGDVQDNEAFQNLDLDGDWDSDAHDRQMSNIFQMENENDGLDDDKPHWDDDIDIDDIIPPQTEEFVDQKGKKKKRRKKETKEEEDGVDVDAMDADVTQPEEEWDGTEAMRKRKLDEYMDELYGLEFNDMVGGMPTRFKYITTNPQSFGLTPAEVLVADDKDLNQYLGIKKYAPYRKSGNWDNKRPERLKELKEKLGNKKGNVDAGVEEKTLKKRKGKKERQKLKAAAQASGHAEVETQPEGNKRKRDEENAAVEGVSRPSKKRKRRQKKATATAE